MSDSDSDHQPEGPQVRVSLKLASNVNDSSLKVPAVPIAVPSDIGRKGLSAVVNHLLGRSVPGEDDDNKSDSDGDDDDDDSSNNNNNNNNNRPLSFEFIVANNRLLRKGVEQEARQHGLSLEEAIVITYFPASNVPELSDEGETVPDWVSCLVGQSSTVFSGCYDGSIHVYRNEKKSTKDSASALIKVDFASVATGPIKAMVATAYREQALIASASMDHTLTLHTYDSSNGLQLYGDCMVVADGGAIQAVSSLDFTNGSVSSPLLLASGDANGGISIWNLDSTDNQDETATASDAKKQKSSSGKKATSTKRHFHASTNMERAHAQLISCVSWGNHRNSSSSGGDNDNRHLVSGSWDHSIKLWDVEKQNCLLTLNGSRVVACLDTSYHSEGVVATGHPDCTIRLWDVRVDNTVKPSAVITDTTFRPSHKAWVSAVKWSPINAFQLASTSHDGTVKVWDIRSSNPLSTVRAFGKEDKGLCLLWDCSSTDQEIIFAGGSDCVIKQLQL